MRPMMPGIRRDPHARGDGPSCTGVLLGGFQRSPRAWGWTGHHPDAHLRLGEIPTRVGMDRIRGSRSPTPSRDPHARGDGPESCAVIWSHHLRSPRAWGWTGDDRVEAVGDREIPTRVGMDRE